MQTSPVRPTVILAFALMAIIVMMILPVPAFLLDIGLAASFSLAVLIFTVTLFVEKPLDFSSFPTILLASLMLRLSLNVSSTKLIIGQGHTGTDAAGAVIESFSNFVMGGSVFLGLVIFCVLLIVNFMVITKGATRMAEVGARFALDGMPGKQMAIDSDVAAGSLTHEEAKARRDREQQETTFFGSLDGASKFVKGDAIAGLLITLLNLCAGLVMGIVVHGMEVSQAFETYAILTVGDGLVSQIPAVIISIASALLLARGGTIGSTDLAIFSQLGKHPAALYSVAVLIFGFALVPGLPFLPFLAGSLVLAGLAYSQQNKRTAEDTEEVIPPEIETPQQRIGDVLELDEIHVEFAQDLVNVVLDPASGIDTRIENMRRHIAMNFGVIIPEIRLSDNPALPFGHYRINIHGVLQSKGVLQADKMMALLPNADEAGEGARDGEITAEPVYGAPAKWIDRSEKEKAALDGMTIVGPTEVLATHLLETIKQNLSRLLTLKSLRRLLNELCRLSDQRRAEANQKLIDELIPDKVQVQTLHSVLRLLLDERVSIRNFTLILEAIAEVAGTKFSPETICEHVRQRLGFQLVAELRRDDGSVPLIQLSPEWEEIFEQYQLSDGGSVGDVALPPDLFNKLAGAITGKLKQASADDVAPALIASAARRRFLNTVLKAKGILVPVLSFEEIGTDTNPALVGVVPFAEA